MAISSLSTITSSLQAYDSALSNSAHNIANANTQGFKSRQSQFYEQNQGGVIVKLSQTNQQLNGLSENTSSETSDTDIATELVNTLQYKAGFLLSAKLIESYQERIGTLIDISE